MRFVAQTKIKTPPLAEAGANITSWLVALIAWFCTVLELIPPALARAPLLQGAIAAAKRQVARDLHRAGAQARQIIALTAFARMRVPRTNAPRRRIPHSRGAMRAHAKLVRAATAGLTSGLHEGSLRQRAERLLALMHNLERAAARVLKRLVAIWRKPPGPHIPLAPTRAPRIAAALIAPACVDTS